MNQEFSPRVVDLGIVRVGEPQTVIFRRENPVKVLKDATASCGCTVPELLDDGLTIRVTYTPRPVPDHLREEGRSQYQTEKVITIYYTDGTIEAVRLIGIVSQQ